MIVDVVEKYLGGDRAKVDEAVLSHAMQGIERSFVRNLTDHEREHRVGIHASSAWYCARRMVYDLDPTAPREALQPRARMTFLMGDVLEQTVIFLARMAGVPILSPAPGAEQESVRLMVEGCEVVGNMDMTVQGPDGSEIPVDVKSMSEYGFKEFERAILDPSHPWWSADPKNGNRWAYLTQLRFYMMAKRAPHGIFVAVDKNTGHMAEMHVAPDPSWEVEFRERAKYLLSWTMQKGLPPRPAWATTKTLPGNNQRPDGSKGPVEEIEVWRCAGYCPHTKSCWPGFGVVPLASKPVWRKAVSA